MATFEGVALLAAVSEARRLKVVWLLRLDHVEPLQALLKKCFLEKGCFLLMLGYLVLVLALELFSFYLKLLLQLSFNLLRQLFLHHFKLALAFSFDLLP